MAATQQNQPDVPRFLADQSGQQSAAINHEGTGKADEYQITVSAQRDRMNQRLFPNKTPIKVVNDMKKSGAITATTMRYLIYLFLMYYY